MEMSYYNVPKIDEVLAKEGWVKFRDNPVYYHDMTEWGQPGRYKLFFPLDFKSHFLLYLEAGLTEKELYKGILNVVPNMPSMITSSIALERSLLLWTADFYHWQHDVENLMLYRDELKKFL